MAYTGEEFKSKDCVQQGDIFSLTKASKEEWVEQCLRSAMPGYKKLFKSEVEGEVRINCPEAMTRNKRRVNRLVGQST